MSEESLGASVESALGFADGEVTGYVRTAEELVVTVRAWNGMDLEARFIGLIGLCDLGVGDISDFRRIACSPFLDRCLARTYEAAIPAEHPYETYIFLDNDDGVAFEVAAESVDVQVCNP